MKILMLGMEDPDSCNDFVLFIPTQAKYLAAVWRNGTLVLLVAGEGDRIERRFRYLPVGGELSPEKHTFIAVVQDGSGYPYTLVEER